MCSNHAWSQCGRGAMRTTAPCHMPADASEEDVSVDYSELGETSKTLGLPLLCQPGQVKLDMHVHDFVTSSSLTPQPAPSASLHGRPPPHPIESEARPPDPSSRGFSAHRSRTRCGGAAHALRPRRAAAQSQRQGRLHLPPVRSMLCARLVMIPQPWRSVGPHLRIIGVRQQAILAVQIPGHVLRDVAPWGPPMHPALSSALNW